MTVDIGEEKMTAQEEVPPCSEGHTNVDQISPSGYWCNTCRTTFAVKTEVIDLTEPRFSNARTVRESDGIRIVVDLTDRFGTVPVTFSGGKTQVG